MHNVSKSSWETFSVTSRSGAPTSRRQIVISLQRRDVDFPRRDVILTLLCHVATCTVTSRRQIVKLSVTSRRGILTSRCGILTSRRHFYTSRRHLVTYSATSRRCPARRDVIWSCSLPRRDVAPHVATLPSEALCHVAT